MHAPVGGDDDCKKDDESERIEKHDRRATALSKTHADGQHILRDQENGGGTLTTASIIEFEIQKRNIRRNSKPATIRVLRVSPYH
jgi:hypothetical protein